MKKEEITVLNCNEVTKNEIGTVVNPMMGAAWITVYDYCFQNGMKLLKSNSGIENVINYISSKIEETASLRAENERLTAENAVLKQQVRELELSNLDKVNTELQVLTTKAENTALKQQIADMGEVIKELKERIINLQSADMTHQYNQAEAERVWPQIEQQIRDDEREKVLAQFGVTKE